MRTFLATLCVLLPVSAFAASPADIAAAARVIQQATSMLEKYANAGIVLEAPTPRPDSEGRYVLPYLDDGIRTEWADKALQAQAGSAAGQEVGKKAAGALASKVPLAGGLLGKKMKDKAGSQGAVMAIGGWEFIRDSSDRSFDKVDDIAVYLHVTHAGQDGYAEALSAAFDIYPDLKARYSNAIKKAQADARKEQRKNKKKKNRG